MSERVVIVKDGKNNFTASDYRHIGGTQVLNWLIGLENRDGKIDLKDIMKQHEAKYVKEFGAPLEEIMRLEGDHESIIKQKETEDRGDRFRPMKHHAPNGQGAKTQETHNVYGYNITKEKEKLKK